MATADYKEKMRLKRLLMQKAYKREGGKCFYCEQAVSLSRRQIPPPPNQATIDHIVTRSEGGEAELNNIVCACAECNGMRGVMPADIFLRFRRGLISSAA